MSFRPAFLIVLAAVVLAAGIGCKKTAPPPPPPTVLSPDTLASVHWCGKRALGYEATAFYFMRIWNLGPTAQLERQTIDRLTTVPERRLPGGSNLAGMSSLARSLMLPVVYDLEQEESYLEVRAAASQPPATVLAIRLTDPGQPGRWFTNLDVVLEKLTGTRALARPQAQGWSFTVSNLTLQLARAGDWTLFAVGPSTNVLADELAARIRRDGVPFVSAGTNLWFEARLDFPRLAAAFPALLGHAGEGGPSGNISPSAGEPGRDEAGMFPFLVSKLATLSLSITGDGGNVLLRGKATAKQPFAAPLEPWHLPVELMHEPLTGFTAVRGVASSLAASPLWRGLTVAAPDQFFLWSLSGGSYLDYLAAPMPAPQVAALTGQLLQQGNPWLAAHGYIGFERAADGNGLIWGNQPDLKPFIRAAVAGDDGWLYAGLFPDTNTAALPPPAGMIQDVLRRTNLVCYDWEVTGLRLQPVLQVAQTARLLLHQPQLAMDSASLNWLGALIPRLGTATTIITRTGPAEFSFARRSTLGLTAPELHLLTGWLETTGP